MLAFETREPFKMILGRFAYGINWIVVSKGVCTFLDLCNAGHTLEECIGQIFEDSEIDVQDLVKDLGGLLAEGILVESLL